MKLHDLLWLPILIPTVIGIIRYKYFRTEMKVLFLFVCFGTFNEILGKILTKVFHATNTMPRSHIYAIVLLTLLGLFYSKILKEFIANKLIRYIYIALIFFYFINAMFIESIWKFASIPFSINALIMIVFSIKYFQKVMIESKIKNLFLEPLILINTAVFFYFTSGLFFYILFNLNLEYSVSFTKLTMIYFSFFNTLFYILIAVAFWKSKNPKYRQENKHLPQTPQCQH